MSDTSLTLSFEGNPVDVVEIEGKHYWSASQVSIAVGYSSDKQVTNNLTSKESWRDEFIEGQDYFILGAKRAKSLKVPETRTFTVPSRGRMMLSEQCVFGIAMFAKTDVGRRFRKWLRSEVLPALAHDGEYKVPAVRTPVETPVERRRRITAEAKAKNAETRARNADLRHAFNMERLSIERERMQRDADLRDRQAEADYRRAMVSDKVGIALTALDSIGTTQNPAIRAAKLAAIEDALGVSLDNVRAELNKTTPNPAHRSQPVKRPEQNLDFATLQPTSTQPELPLVEDPDDWRSPTVIAQQLKIPGIGAREIGGIATDLGLKQTSDARATHGRDYTTYKYNQKAVTLIVRYIKEQSK